MASTTREAALAAVRARPGASITEVAQRLGVDHSTAEYHLRRLHKAGDVASRREGRCRRFFANGCGLCPVLKASAPVVARPSDRRVLRALAAHPDARAQDLANRTGEPVTTVRWVLRKARGRGLVARSGYGRFRVPREAEPCVRHALADTPCRLWGRCTMSVRWRARERDAAS